MSKFTKKSLAVLTTAAIMASTAGIVAYADHTLPADLKVVVTDNRGNESDFTASTRTYKDDVLSWTAPAGKIVKVNGKVNKTGSYTITANDEVITITLEDAPSGGGATDPCEENFDSTVWVNGKDTKASKDGKTPASLYKTEQYDQVMMSAGGKWQVAVTGTDIDSPEKFAALVVDGKFDKTTATKTKELATAKIKDGTVTVTAGKKAGEVKVWVYEIKNKNIVASEVEGNAFFGKLDDSVMPVDRDFEVKIAPKMVTTTKATTVKEGTIEAISSVEKLAKDYDAGSEVVVYFGDKNAAASLDATYVLWDGKNNKALEPNDEGKYVKEGEYTAELVQATETAGPAVKITIDAKATNATKIDVQVRNVESQKIAKIAPKVKKPAATVEEFTLTVADGIKVKVGTEEKALTDGKIKLAKGTKVTFDVDVTIGDKDVTAGTEYEVTADATVALKAAE